MKIQIIGYSGAGKSTLAVKLAKHYDIPFIHLDNVHFFDAWQERPLEEENQIVRAFLSENESWVIDGNYSRVAPERFAQSDLTIFLNYNRIYCYWKSLQRYWKNRGKSRSSCGCIEKFDREFQRWILIDGRTKARRKNHRSNLQKTPGRQVMFKNVRQLNRWLSASSIEK
jgi:adenylate kinase family enzyme